MIRLTIDDHNTEFQPESSQNLGEFLEAVSASLPNNRIVTNVSLDGSQIHRSQSQELFQKTLDSIQEVQIHTAERAIWAATGIDMALSCLEGLQRSLLRASELFREEDTLKANRLFVHCMEGLERFLETLAITRHAMRLDFKQYQVDGQTLSQMEAQLSNTLHQLAMFQNKAQYAAAADSIEYGLLTNLCGWGSALKQIRKSQLSNA